MRPIRAVAAWFRDLGLVWKLLVPLVGMALAVALVGTFAIVRDLTDRAEVDLDRDLLRESTTAESALGDLGLSLIESLRFGANLEGVADGLDRGDEAATRERLASVVAAQPDLDLLVATDPEGFGLVEVVSTADGLEVASGTRWDEGDAGRILARPADVGSPTRSAFLSTVHGEFLATAGPVTLDGRVVGTIIVGVDADDAAAFASQRTGGPVELYDASGALLAVAGGTGPESTAIGLEPGSRIRRTEERAGQEVAVLYGPLEVTGERVGQLAVRLPTSPAFAAARGATLRLVLLVLAALGGVIVLGVLITRLVLRQVRPLVDTSRAIGAGDLSARAERFGNDELGEVARRMNEMAEQLAAAQTELEMRVAARTEELEHLHRDLVRAEEGRSEFFNEVVHEFRNHLFAISAHAEMLQEPDFDPQAAGDSGRAIGGAAEDLLRRVDEILELARAEAGKTDFEFEDVQVADEISHLRPTVAALARRGALDADFHVPGNLPRVRADRQRLGQILMNLVSNAVKYTPPGGRVEVRARRSADAIEISVADTGIGVPEDAGDEIFEPFYRAAGRAEAPTLASSGLGLAVTRRLVEGHGGRVSYVSNPEAGTTFTVTLPVTNTNGRRKRRGDRRTASKSRI